MFWLQVLLLVTAAVGVLIAVAGFYAYNVITDIPDLPAVNLNTWWGTEANKKNPDLSIRPFKVLFSDSMQDELFQKFDFWRRINGVKSFNDTGSTYGLSSKAVETIFDHWQFKYKYNQRQKYFNKFNHFLTNIQGLDIHFLHVKPNVDKNVKVVPLLLLHGWPGSVREFYEVIPILTNINPEYNFVFEVIVPSLPGFAYSQATTKPGLNTIEIAIIMRNLMGRLGFKQYYIQGGDFGHSIGSHMATLFPKEIIGFHTNFPINFSKQAMLAWVLGSVWPNFIEEQYWDRMYPLTEKNENFLEESGYMHLQATKPDTIGIALQDSPMGLATYIIDRFLVFTNPSNKLQDDGGISTQYSLTDLLDNVMLYWATDCITTSMRLYKETFRRTEIEQLLARIPTNVPTWGLRFKYENAFQPEFIIRWKYRNLVGTTTRDYGGHFAAFERPEEFASDVFLAVHNFMEISN